MSVKLLLDERFLPAAVGLIEKAKKEVYIIAYILTVPSHRKPGREVKLFEALLKAKKRGLDCKVLLNYTYPQSKVTRQNKEAFKWLGFHGIKCRYVSRNRTVHAKMIIIDGVTLIIGSHNWSRRAVERNVEASVKVKETGVVEEARERFLELWKDAVDLEEVA